VPLFYDRGPDGIPHGWLKKMRRAIQTVAPVFSLARMLKEYCTRYYFPAGRFGQQIEAGALAHELALWEQQVRAAWPQVTVEAFPAEVAGRPVAEARGDEPVTVRAVLRPGPLPPDFLAVELVYGVARDDGKLDRTRAVPMAMASGGSGEYHYQAVLGPIEQGAVRYGVRVRPHHPALPVPFILPLLKWAQ